ncbi:MAG: hypothetical protein CMH76_00035 [Nitrospinae bacterium]|jgi:uncharacterized RDD family membrane protein YckC|nr:hypothetical protein [Nitrospinota bacterium]
MKCPKCGYIASDYLDQCKKCNADWVSEKARLGIKAVAVKPAEPTEAVSFPEDSLPELEVPSGQGPPPEQEWQAEDESELRRQLEVEFDALYQRLRKEEELEGVEGKTQEGGVKLPRGGVGRRVLAFYVDLAVLYALSWALSYSLYVAYTVGLAAHGEMLTPSSTIHFIQILLPAWIFLTGCYFVLLHGMDGRTVGKWFLGLRVVAAGGVPISYGQALVRLLVYPLTAIFGIGFLWILFSRERRGLHDLLARTWVIRDVAAESR